MADSWSAAEQALLEEALVLYSTDFEPNVKKRWNSIAKHVGKSAKECVKRVKECADEVIHEKEAVEKESQLRQKEIEDREKERVANLSRLQKKEEEDRIRKEKQEAEERAIKEQAEKDRKMRMEETDRRIARDKQAKIDAEAQKQEQQRQKENWARQTRINDMERKKKAKEDKMERAAHEALAAIASSKKPGTEATPSSSSNAPANSSSTSYYPASASNAPVPDDIQNDECSAHRRAVDSQNSVVDECPLCADKADIWTVGPCSHRSMCAYCGMKMRLLLDDKRCMKCMVEIEDVLYTPSVDIPYSTYGISGKIATGRAHVVFDDIVDGFVEGTENRERLRNLQSFRNCPMENCGYRGDDTLIALERHLTKVHGCSYCRLCLEFKKMFIQQRVPYTKPELQKHLRYGDYGNQGHPQCKFCKKRFYSESEYGSHLKQEHFWCHVCEKLGRRDVFFGYREQVMAHFDQCHFVCRDPECLKDTWVAFGTADELCAHNVDKHNKREIVCLVNFQYNRNNRGAPASGSDDVFYAPTPAMTPVLSREQDFPSLPGGAPKAAAPVLAPGRRNANARRDDFPALGASQFPALGASGSASSSGAVPFSPPARAPVSPKAYAVAATSGDGRTVGAKAAAPKAATGKAPGVSTSSADFPHLPKPVAPSRHVPYVPKTWAVPKAPVNDLPYPKMKMTQKQKRKKEMQALAFNQS